MSGRCGMAIWDLWDDVCLVISHCCGRYTGERVLDERVEVLLEAAWRPAPEGAFPDLPQSPRANSSASSAAGPAMPQGYVAPHLRGTGACRPCLSRIYVTWLRTWLGITGSSHFPRLRTR